MEPLFDLRYNRGAIKQAQVLLMAAVIIRFWRDFDILINEVPALGRGLPFGHLLYRLWRIHEGQL
jgi:hypothetical protein